MNIMQKKTNRYLAAAVIMALLVFGCLLYYIYHFPNPTATTPIEEKPVERHMDKILESLSAPSGSSSTSSTSSSSSESISKESQTSISAPKQGKKPLDDVSKSLTAPE